MIIYMLPTLGLIQQHKGIHEVQRILDKSELRKTVKEVECVVRKEEEEILMPPDLTVTQ